MGRGREEEEERQHARASAVPRRGRWLVDDGQQQQPSAAGQARWRCRSCAAAAIADCVALACCPCAVVTLLWLVLVRAPLAVGRRLRRRNRRSSLVRRKRMRDVANSSAGKTTARDRGAKAAAAGAACGGTMQDPAADDHATVGAAAAPVQQQQMQGEAAEEPAWLDEMYRAGHWGFGRVSFSGSIGGEKPREDRPACGEIAAATRQPYEWDCRAVPAAAAGGAEQSWRASSSTFAADIPSGPPSTAVQRKQEERKRFFVCGHGGASSCWGYVTEKSSARCPSCGGEMDLEVPPGFPGASCSDAYAGPGVRAGADLTYMVQDDLDVMPAGGVLPVVSNMMMRFLVAPGTLEEKVVSLGYTDVRTNCSCIL